MKMQHDDFSITDNIYLYVKDTNEEKYQYLIKMCEKNGLKNLKYPKIVTEYSNNMKDVYKNIEDYYPGTVKCNLLILFDDMIVDMISNKKLNQIVTELSIRGNILNIFTGFIKQNIFPVSKYVRLNLANFFIMKIPNKRKIKKTAFDNSSFNSFDNPLRFKKKLLEII